MPQSSPSPAIRLRSRIRRPRGTYMRRGSWSESRRERNGRVTFGRFSVLCDAGTTCRSAADASPRRDTSVCAQAFPRSSPPGIWELWQTHGFPPLATVTTPSPLFVIYLLWRFASASELLYGKGKRGCNDGREWLGSQKYQSVTRRL